MFNVIVLSHMSKWFTTTKLALYMDETSTGCGRKNPRFGRAIASGGEHVQWWGAHRRTAVYVPFSVYTVAWSGEHRAFIVEEFIRNGGSPVATQRAFHIRFALGQ